MASNIIDLRHDMVMELKLNINKICSDKCKDLRSYDRMRCVIECLTYNKRIQAIYRRATQEIIEVWP